MKNEFFIYLERKYKHFTIKTIHGGAISLKTEIFEDLIKKYNPKTIIEYMKKIILNKKELEKELKELDNYYGIKDYGELIHFDIVQREIIEEVKGLYYAHEYNQYAPGERKTYQYSNNYIEHEIECLNENLIVADGVWEEPDNNGCGDRFETTKIIFKKEINNNENN